MAFSIKVEGLENVLQRFRALPARIQKEVSAELKLSAEEVRRQAIRDAPADQGKLRQNITVNQETGIAFSTVVQNQYAAYQEWGTKKKKRIPAEVAQYAAQFQGPGPKTGITLNAAIEAWVKRKGIGGKGRGKNAQANRKNIAFLIARKIRREGVNPHPYFFKNVFLVRDKLKARLEQIVRDI